MPGLAAQGEVSHFQAHGKDLVAAIKPPSKLKKKAVYFAKLAKAAVTAESVAAMVAWGELSEAPLEALLVGEVTAARAEAADNARYLRPLRPMLERLATGDDFAALADLARPLTHMLLLVWAHSSHFNTAGRLVPLLRLVLRDVVAQTRRFAPGLELLAGEAADTADKLRQALHVADSFRAAYLGARQRSAQLCPRNPWRFAAAAVLGEFDPFLARLRELQHIALTAPLFQRLERVEIGGSRGKALTTSVRSVLGSFLAAFAKVQAVTTDPLDLPTSTFAEEAGAFNNAIVDLERRLAAVAELYKTQRQHPTWGRNGAPFSGAVNWCRGLRERITGPMERVRGMRRAVVESDEGREVTALYERLSARLAAFELDTVAAWTRQLLETSDQKLKQPLLTVALEASRVMLAVNFDPALIALLREVRYFMLLRDLPSPIPAPALKARPIYQRMSNHTLSSLGYGTAVTAFYYQVYERADAFRAEIGNLDLICNIHNNIQRTMLPVEKPLIQDRLDAVDVALQQGLAVLTWNSHHIDERIAESLALVDAEALARTTSAPLVEVALELVDVRTALKVSEERSNAFRAQFLGFAHLWTTEMQVYLKSFLAAKGTAREDGQSDDPPLAVFEAQIMKYRGIQEEVQALPANAIIGYLKVDARPVKQALLAWVTKWIFLFTNYLESKASVVGTMKELYSFTASSNTTLDIHEAADGPRPLYVVMACMRDIRKRSDRTDACFYPLRDTVALLLRCGIFLSEAVLKQLEEAPLLWKALKKKMRESLSYLQQAEAVEIRRKSDGFQQRVEDFRAFFLQAAPFAVTEPELAMQHDLFELYIFDHLLLTRCTEELGHLKSLWDMVGAVMATFSAWHATLWDNIQVDELVEEARKMIRDIKTLNKAVRGYEVYRLLEEALKAMLTSLPLATGKTFVMDASFSLGDLLRVGLHQAVDACSEIIDRAQKELIIEKAIQKIEDTWGALTFAVVQMTVEDAATEALETDNLALQTMSGGKYVQGNAVFLEKVTTWQRKLGMVDAVLSTWTDVQRKWQALESIFVGSADIRVQLPEDSKRFDSVNADFQDLMKGAPELNNVDYLETKRVAFPRFYFVAPADLLDILSKGSDPQLILRHLPKNFDNVHNLEFLKDGQGEPTSTAIGMYSGEKEHVEFAEQCKCEGAVEVWLQNVVDAMRAALSAEYKAAVVAYDEKPRGKWLFDQSVQTTITTSRTFFTQEINGAFNDMEDGKEDALKVEYERQVSQLSELIELITGQLSPNDRKKLVTLCTIDVHARDVVQRLLDERVDNVTAFQWQSQLRYSQHDKTRECQVNICDAEIKYSYEYIGNCGCLCITPLSDRCYITLTQAQRLILGGAPAGPAGTGKTETTKDLARALGVQCYVFNCSDQMDYKAMGQIYKGLAQTGAWGCFDEFNRIPVAVLSVCSTQYKTVLDALRARKDRFIFDNVDVALKPSVMAFITMNPGYPGRAELPESLKALFRPCSMCVPDLSLIAEVMLMAEGFQLSKMLSRKFVILYKLCEDLLSKSQHYDWKLRAIKTTLYVAGGMRRASPDMSEDKVLLRALRDFNLGKLTADDTSIFTGLLNDLFPKTAELVPRHIDHDFESKVREAAIELGYQPDDKFCLKVSQLREILVVRWSIFLLGPAGCGKSAIWRTLMRAQQLFGEKTVYKPINPKSVTRNELYGSLNPATREWREGLISVTFRDMANNRTNKHQWIVLDGDIDAEWIESMNTVMDDNKMLTLASNERIPLTPSMRLLLEINHMRHCSPATVSRGGVIYVNADDIGWRPAVESWMAGLEASEFRPLLAVLFERYVETSIEHCRRNFKAVVPLPAVAPAMAVCHILESLLPKETVRGTPPPDKKLLEHHFVFACVWAFGGTMLVDKVSDYRAQFSKWWVSEWKAVQFPEKGLVYDYFVDDAQVQMVHWDQRVPTFSYSPGSASVFVPTVETTRLTYFLDSLIARKHHVMFVGNTGSGKTAIMQHKLRALDADTLCYAAINLNSFSDAPALQTILEQSLEKKSGVRFGPPGSKRLVYFVDDMNMPFVDKYDTQSAIELLRQSLDYKGWFDKVKIVLKEVTNIQYSACINPTAGSFNITPRMQRHFATFAVQMPSLEIARSIFSAILDGHLGVGGFDGSVAKLGPRLVDLEARPLLYGSFMVSNADDEPVYAAIPGYDVLRKALDAKLAEYNEANPVMDLVLFQQAMEHVCRITRIIALPRGNAMLIVNEKFLVYINDLLSTGYVADLCTPEDKVQFCNAVRKYLHVVLCFSPVGDRFRIRARQFPALVNCTSFDWFHTWPSEALVSVATRFLVDIPDVQADVRESLSLHMAFAHLAVADASQRYLESVRRYNYTTPKSYLELISLYKSLLAQKRAELRGEKERLESGVDKIQKASAQVADLQVMLQQEQVVVEEKKAATQQLIESIGKEKAVADVTAFQDECARDLALAEPVIKEAEAALNSLDKASLGELKSFGSPAAEDLSWAAGKKFMGNVDAFLKSLLAFDKDNVPLACADRVEKDYISNPAFNADNIRTKSGAAAGLCAWVINICKYFRIYQAR
ncbi:hypothetical protein WJX81_007069 [Elliptochloris bilobata]|uniref:AAA+ ATPase domain-containing protein n=1 Tax=Elliptochloris bilobata TaxID=381761 RepID=A0AAW1SCB6_9CHLO